MANLKLDDKTAEFLLAGARAQGLSVDEFIQLLLRQQQCGGVRSPTLSAEDFDRLLDSEVTDTPGLPVDFSRADIYADHD
ncbi:MAG: hypothetical protein HYX69_09545 [Planctomycetia bacterium]|nr:hypothetical protein [Planctomycetia bacterium]